MIRFYLDEGVQGAIARGLRRRGVDVVRVQDEEREGTPDPLVLDRATELGRVLFTQDTDFLAEAQGRQERGEPFEGIVFAHQDTPVGHCVEFLELIAGAGDPNELANVVYHLPAPPREE